MKPDERFSSTATNCGENSALLEANQPRSQPISREREDLHGLYGGGVADELVRSWRDDQSIAKLRIGGSELRFLPSAATSTIPRERKREREREIQRSDGEWLYHPDPAAALLFAGQPRFCYFIAVVSGNGGRLSCLGELKRGAFSKMVECP